MAFSSTTTAPLRIYHANPEFLNRDDPNDEIKDAQNVTIFGIKDEGKEVLYIRDSDHVNVFSMGGLTHGDANSSTFTVERTPNFRLTALVSRKGTDTDPGSWHIVSETTAATATATAPYDRPVLYRRGFETWSEIP